MSEINNNGFNPNKEIKMPQPTSLNNSNINAKNNNITEKQQTDASAPVSEALGKSMVKVDNHDADMQRLLKNPQLAEVSDKMFNAACRAGLSYPEAATFATTEA